MRRLLFVPFLLLPAVLTAQSHPVFMNTAADNARFAAWKANYDANPTSPSGVGGKIYKFAKDTADLGTWYGDSGQWAAFVYRMGGGASYADTSYAKITTSFLARPVNCTSTGLGGNYLREHGWIRVMTYDWIYDQLDAGERTTFLDRLNTMAACSTGSLFGTGGDSDQTTGAYFLSAMLHFATTSYNSTINTMWNDVTRKWGGYAATGVDTTTYRNAIGYYASVLGNGGMWPEATEYNLNTLKHACVPSKILRDLQAPTDNYDDLETFCENAAYALIYETVVPNHSVNRAYVWGDTQQNDSAIASYRGETGFALAGINIGKTSGPYIQDWILDYLSTTDVTTLSTYNIRGFLHFDPDATRGDYTALPLSRFFAGAGMMIARTGWTNADAMFGAHMPGLSGGIHHAPYYFGEFQIRKNGHWPFTHLLTYGGFGLDWRGTNGVGIRSATIINAVDHFEYKAGDNGLETKANQYPHELAYKIDTTNNFVYLAGTRGGSVERSGSAGVPPAFLQEYSRSFVWLPSLGGALVIHDRTNVKSIAEGACNTGYPTTYMNQVNSGKYGFKDQFFHMPTSPTTAGGATTWTYASGAKTARINHLLPASPTITTVNEVTFWGSAYASNGVRGGYHILIRPSSDQRWDTFLNVLDPYETGTTITTTLVQDTTNKADAALLARSGTNYLVVFNAIQGPDIPNVTGANCSGSGASTFTGLADDVLDTVRLRQTGYTLSFTGPSGGTKAVLLDLAPSIVWTYTINGGAPSSITEDSMGVATVNIANTGAITLAVIAGGEEPSLPPVVIQTASLPDSQQGQACGTTVLAATGGNGGPYTWSKTAGTYPTGCSVNASGTYSGTASAAGTYNFTMQACDSQPECDTQDYTVIIATVPTITAGYDNATVNSVYSDTLTVTGGTPPYTCVKNSGSVGTGLTFNVDCSISGTPTVAGTYSFNVTATDSLSASSPATDMQLIVLPQTVLTEGNVRASQVTDSQVIVHFGKTGMDISQDCTASLIDGEAIQASVTSTEGDAMRTAVFEGLDADTPYTIDIDCPGAVNEAISIRTDKGIVRENSTTDLVMKFKPSANLIARSVAKVSVRAYDTDDLGTIVDSELHLSCTTGCTVTLTLPRPQVYVIRYDWETAADAVVQSSRRANYWAIP